MIKKGIETNGQGRGILLSQCTSSICPLWIGVISTESLEYLSSYDPDEN